MPQKWDTLWPHSASLLALLAFSTSTQRHTVAFNSASGMLLPLWVIPRATTQCQTGEHVGLRSSEGHLLAFTEVLIGE